MVKKIKDYCLENALTLVTCGAIVFTSALSGAVGYHAGRFYERSYGNNKEEKHSGRFKWTDECNEIFGITEDEKL